MNAIYYVRAIAVPVTSRMLLDGVVHECQCKLILRTLKNNWDRRNEEKSRMMNQHVWTLGMDHAFVR